MTMSTRESDIQRQVRVALEAAGHKVERIQSGKIQHGRHWIRMASPGTPDLICIPRGLPIVFLETKTDEGKLSLDQMNWHSDTRDRGHKVFVVRSAREALEVVRGVAS